MAYQPTQADLAWGRMALGLIKDGGTWVFPAAQLVYVVSHTGKTVRLVNEYAPLSADQKEMHHRAIQVLNGLGYQALPKELEI